MENRKSPGIAFWCCVAGTTLGLYIAAYGFMRWQDVLIHDVKYSTGSDGITRSGIGITANYYEEDTTDWQEALGPPAERVFFPLCEIETKIRWKLRRSGWHDHSLE